MYHVTNLPLWKSRPFSADFILGLDCKWISGPFNGRDWSLTYEKIIRKSLHKAQVLCPSFCSTMQDYKEKINYCASICNHQISLTNSFNSSHHNSSFLLQSSVYFCHLNYFPQFFAQVPQPFFCLLNFLRYFDPNYLSPTIIFRTSDKLS